MRIAGVHTKSFFIAVVATLFLSGCSPKKVMNLRESPEPTPAPTSNGTPEGVGPGLGAPRACTLEAKICPDGNTVGRTGPNCEFSACPEVGATPQASTVPGIEPILLPSNK